MGEVGFNQKLSEQRAEAIYHALIKRGISADRMTFSGLGESKPILANTIEKNRKKNRRVEIVFNK